MNFVSCTAVDLYYLESELICILFCGKGLGMYSWLRRAHQLERFQDSLNPSTLLTSDPLGPTEL